MMAAIPNRHRATFSFTMTVRRRFLRIAMSLGPLRSETGKGFAGVLVKRPCWRLIVLR